MLSWFGFFPYRCQDCNERSLHLGPTLSARIAITPSTVAEVDARVALGPRKLA